MEIQIKSNENGWETDRKLVLPDDRKLTDAILRTVRRYQRNLEKAAAKETNAEEAAEEMSADTQEEIVETPAEEAPAPTVEKEPEFKGVSGFILAQCEECKDTWAFCSKYRVKFVMCKKCGHRTELRDIAPANLQCVDCGKHWRYQTNCTDADLGCKCVGCGHEMRSWWEPKKRLISRSFDEKREAVVVRGKELPECFRYFQFDRVPSRAEVDEAYEDMKAIILDIESELEKVLNLAELLRRYNTCIYYLEQGKIVNKEM